MGKNSITQLASELKKFLLEQEEDELIYTAASTQVAAGVSHAPKTSVLLEKPTLTVQFPRAQARQEKRQAASVAQPQAVVPQGTPMMTTAQKEAALEELAQTIKTCTRCPLGATRLNAVPGEGNVDADVMFVGEGPGYDEDRQGRPFVGRAGNLLDKMIVAMGLTREQVFIANIAKCHPMTDPQHPEKHGNDRAPNAAEIACCRKYLEQQIAIVCPKYIVALGSVSAKALISDAKSLGALRGRFYNLALDNVTLPRPVQVLATFHPAALLRNPNWKKDAWKDLQMVMAELGLKGLAK